MKFPDSVFDSLPIFHDKIKVSVRKIMKTFEYLVRIAESQQAWLNLLMIGNGNLHGSSLTLANTHGIKLNVTTGI